ncbi:alpha/beta hydrolase [Deltaproteobacteria bacterium]|nr:alpha/beta hydrolase [Deltaproteobacteria bacterium]
MILRGRFTSLILAGLLVWPVFSLASAAAAEVKTLTQDQWVGAKQTAALATGLNMKYVEMGPANGEVIIFLHGMTDNSRSWSLIAPYFTDKYHIYMLDQRGHGDTDKPDLRLYPTSLYAADLAAFMDIKGLKKAHIVGHSLGSMIAQDFAVNYPEKVDKLVLESSAPVEFASLGRSIYDAAVGFGSQPPADDFMSEWYANPNPVNEDFLKWEMAESRAIPPQIWRAIAKGASYSNLTPFMDELKASCLILWGGQDSFFGAETQEALKKLIPQARFIAYEKNGHNLQWEIPEKMAGDVRAFLENR